LQVEERVVEMPHGDREVVVENVDLPAGEVCYWSSCCTPHLGQARCSDVLATFASFDVSVQM